jgi:predicted dehydrogenase
VYIGEFYRYIPCVEAVKDIIDSGGIGIPEQMRYYCGLPYNEISAWESAYSHIALEDLAFHHFSVIHYMLDITPAEIIGVSHSPLKGGGIGGTVSSSLIKTVGGCHISHEIDWHNTMRSTGFLGDFYIDGSVGGVSVEDGRVYFMEWGGEKKEIAVGGSAERTAPEKILAGKYDEVWTALSFRPVMDCIYKSIGVSCGNAD